jgi:FkbM family methyltransferase
MARQRRWPFRGDRHKQNDSRYFPQQPSCQIPNLWALYRQFLGERESGTFVEIGAYDGLFVSNSWGLAVRGWRGLLVEPVSEFAELARLNHRPHPNVKVVETAVGAPGESELELGVSGTLTSAWKPSIDEVRRAPWASGAQFENRHISSVKTLDELLNAEAFPPEFDVLVVDVEGYETQVFSGFNLALWRPSMMVVELVDCHPDLSATAQADAALSQEIVDSGYVVVYKDHINTVFVEATVYRDGVNTKTVERTAN